MLTTAAPEPAETPARRCLRELASLAETLRDGLLSTHALLPISPREDLMLLGEEEADFATEARRTIECVLADCLAPCIQALRTAADYRREEEADATSAAAGGAMASAGAPVDGGEKRRQPRGDRAGAGAAG